MRIKFFKFKHYVSIYSFLFLLIISLNITGCSISDNPSNKKHGKKHKHNNNNNINNNINNNNIYIDPSVAVTGNGTIDSPYKSWSEVIFIPGYSYLQKRGTIAYEQITINASGMNNNFITIGAYGSGNAPIIQGSEKISGWTLESGNIYSKVIDPGSGGFGLIAENGVVLKNYTWNSDINTTFSSAAAGSFSYNYFTDKLYIWCTNNANPSSRIIDVSMRYFGIRGLNVSYINIENINVRYVSLHGIVFENSNNINVNNCIVENSGGALVDAVRVIYAGNGIDFSNNCSNCFVSNCIVSDIFDSGICPEVFTSNSNASNFYFKNSAVSRCGFAGVEIPVLYNGGMTNMSTSNVTVDNMTIIDSGKGWSGMRYGNEGRGIKVCADINGTDTTRSISGVIIKNTAVSGCTGEGIFIGGKSGTVIIERCEVKNNVRDGILAQAIGLTDIKLNVFLSLIHNNGTANYKSGVAYNVPYGNGFNLYHNTFYNNYAFGLGVWTHSGSAELINNIFHSASSKYHLFTNVDLPAGSKIYNNFFTEFSGNNIIAYNGSTYQNVSGFNSAYAFASNNIGGSNPILNINFSLQNNSSPCYMAGNTTIGIIQDYIKNKFHNPPSIGAYEYY